MVRKSKHSPPLLPKSVVGNNDHLPRGDRSAWVGFWSSYYSASERGRIAVAGFILMRLAPLLLFGGIIFAWSMLR
jgi:hypothetical protein